MGAALAELGFETTTGENVTRLAFTRAWQRFLNSLEPGDTAALFFAGHGVEINGVNYLLPHDVPKVVAGEEQVLGEAVAVAQNRQGLQSIDGGRVGVCGAGRHRDPLCLRGLD